MLVRFDNTYKYINSDVEELEQLPARNYLVRITREGEYYLEGMQSFSLPSKLYGNLDELSERYLNTFKDKPGNLGILLKGLKGTGKSLLARKICIDSGLPVLIVQQAFAGVGFASFLNNIKQEVIVFIDEFEKIYRGYSPDGDEDITSQEALLSVLDGVFDSSKLFLFTANNEYKIANALYNRPGRIHYLKNYQGLEKEVIEEVIDDILINKAHKHDLLTRLKMIGKINLDLLISVLEEMNRYNDDAKTAIGHLNISIEAVKYKARIPVSVSVIYRKTTDHDYTTLELVQGHYEAVIDDPFENADHDQTLYGALDHKTMDKVYKSLVEAGAHEEMAPKLHKTDYRTNWDFKYLERFCIATAEKVEYKDDRIEVTVPSGEVVVLTPIVQKNVTNAYSELAF